MATKQDKIAAGAEGAIGGGLSTAATTAALFAINPVLGVGYALWQTGQGASQKVQEEKAKALAKAQKQALEQDKQATKLANQRKKKSKQEDALLAGSMDQVAAPPTTGTQYDKFQADTFG